MKQLTFVLAVAVAVLAPVGAARAQEHARDIPAEHRPPPGMCRIWLDNVPSGQQPAPTDCPTAVKHKPSNGRVIFGDDYVEKEKGDGRKPKQLPPFVKSFGAPGGASPATSKPKRPTPADSL